MIIESLIYIVVFVLWLPAAALGARAVRDACRFRRLVRRSVAAADEALTSEGRFKYAPRVAIIMPCCGVDEKLEQTVRALAEQNYPDYEVIFTFASEHDAAFAVVAEWTSDWGADCPGARRVVAGNAKQRGQKIHNLLAAVDIVSPDREVIVFLDSDAVPHADWLGHLVAPLQDDAVGASTGYRWYRAGGGLAQGLRCAWNAATVPLLADETSNLVWGGSTAMRRERFESLRIAEYWDRGLSDDLLATRAIREAGLKIRFVPQALIASSDQTTLGGFLEFAGRQVVITRICHPGLWRDSLMLTVAMMAGGVATAALLLACLVFDFGEPVAMYASLVAWLVIAGQAAAMSIVRQLGLRCVLKTPDITWRDFAWDVGGNLTVAGGLHLQLFMRSIGRRRIVWRGIEYEMVSPLETRIVRRGA